MPCKKFCGKVKKGMLEMINECWGTPKLNREVENNFDSSKICIELREGLKNKGHALESETGKCFKYRWTTRPRLLIWRRRRRVPTADASLPRHPLPPPHGTPRCSTTSHFTCYAAQFAPYPGRTAISKYTQGHYAHASVTLRKQKITKG